MPSTRIVVADDATHQALYLQHMLKKVGYDVRVVARSGLIQAALNDFKPAALLLNVELNEHTGKQVCLALRSEPRNAGLIIVFITGQFLENATDLANAGANGFLLKPVSPGALVGKLAELGLRPDTTHAGLRETGSGMLVQFADASDLSALERFKIELTLGLAPLANALRVGAYFIDATNRGWIVRPDGCQWPSPEDAVVSANALDVKIEDVSIDSSHVCRIMLCSDKRTGAAANAALLAGSALLRQILRVVEFGRQREDLFEELGLDHECLNSMYDISSEGQMLRKPEQAFDKIAKRTARAMSVSGPVKLILWIKSETTGLLEAVRCHGIEAHPLPRSVTKGLIGKCFQEGKSQVVVLDRSMGDAPEPEFHKATHIAVAPVKSPHGSLGAIAVWHESDWAIDSRHVRLLEAMAAQTATAISNDQLVRKTIDSEILERELAIGGKIQESLLFGTPPLESPDFEFGLFAAPSLQVGGDFFEFFHYGSSCDVVIGDVMGKGVPAALVGAAVKGQFLRYARERRGDASSEAKNIVASVHRDVSRRLINLECFITVCYARFDAVEHRMTYVDCGHPRPLHFRADTGQAVGLEFDWPRLVNIPLGTHPQAQYEQASVEIHPGDIFLFYSDGFTEAVGEDNRLFGEEALLNLLVKHSSRHADEIAARIQSSLQSFVKAGGIRDDLTCIVVKVLDSAVCRAESGDVLEVDARADQLSRLRAFVQIKCEGIPFFKQEEQQLSNLQLAVTEAATNIVKYAYKDMPVGKVKMQLVADHRKVEIKLFDTGCAFDPSSVPEPVMEGLQESGRGVYLIKAMMDEVSYLRDANGVNCLRMVKNIERRRKRTLE
ncbi:MAG: SpoIIE family protein phosphatase [Planctomycetota bacterium]